MKNESVAILDIRSNEVSFLLGAKGVNNTFVYKGRHSEKYEGYCLDGFFDEESFRRAVARAIGTVQQTYQGQITSIHVGVPSAFVSAVTKGHTMSFYSKRKLTAQDIDALYESGLNDSPMQGRCIRQSAMYFTLGDNRKYFTAEELYGMPTTMLKGALCYYFVSEYFYLFITELLENMGFTDVKFIPSTLAQSIYLLPEKKREGYAFLLDIGFVTSSISVVYGNGIVHEENFNCGIASVLVGLIKTFEIDFPVAEEILAISNISGGNVPKDLTYTSELSGQSFSVQMINEVIKQGLDELCERIDVFLRRYYHDQSSGAMSVNPISVTGEGVSGIKGATEHIAKRVSWLTETVYPDLPYYDKPTCSSRIALLNMAIADQKKKGFLSRIFSKFGGNN
ncbi:MAG: hypothetical protein E7371_05780 [Clostridiales bacterium]|nr:hypothetical protein [Clostridiales bacterium]